jgi:predicted transcriptional regulator
MRLEVYPSASHLSTNNYAKSEGVNGMADEPDVQDLHSLTAEIVASFVGNNTVAVGDLPTVIAGVFGALRSAAQPEAEQPAPAPAVPIKRSIGTDYLICLEDGRKVTMLKRYLARRYNLTPEQYRQRWGLPKSYPMVAPAYAARRSELAKELGLGRKPAPEPVAAPPAPQPRRRVGERKKSA